MKNPLAIGLRAVAIAAAFTGVNVFATLYSDRADWEAALDPHPGTCGIFDLPFDVDETQWGTGFSLFAAGTSILLPNGPTLTFDTDLLGAQVPVDWSTWSGGQTPRVLYSSALTVNGVFSSPVDAFGLEMEPNPFIDVNMTLTLSDGSSLTQAVSGLGGARFFGWTDQPVVGMTLSADTDFAFGRMVGTRLIARDFCIPDSSASFMLLSLGLAAIGGLRRTINK